MKKRALVPAIVLAAALVPAPALAWSFAGHGYIMGRAIELLPPQLKKFFDHYRDEIVVRAIDPDLWRNVGWDEEPHHFMNFGAPELGDYPFTALPRELGAAIEKFGMATLRRDGMLPWRAQELFGNLRCTFDALLASYRLVDSLLKADSEAIAGKDTYDDAYFEKFFTKVKPILEQRLAEAISATAGLIIGAWDAAGKPALNVEGARPVEKVKKPGII